MSTKKQILTFSFVVSFTRSPDPVSTPTLTLREELEKQIVEDKEEFSKKINPGHNNETKKKL